MSIQVMSLSKDDRRLLLETTMGHYLYGSCYTFATALNKALGWPLVGIARQSRDGRDIIHCSLHTPEGEIFDIRGRLTEEEFQLPYTPNEGVVDTTTQELQRLNPFPLKEHGLNAARLLAETLYPDLPWPDTALLRTIRYVQDLEKLSREHGLWIHHNPSSARPIINQAHGDEIGYVITVTLTPGVFQIDCVPE